MLHQLFHQIGSLNILWELLVHQKTHHSHQSWEVELVAHKTHLDQYRILDAMVEPLSIDKLIH